MLEIYLPIVQVNIDIFLLLFLSLVVGVLSGLFGVGGGFLMTPFLIFMGIPPVYAVPNEVNNILAGFDSEINRTVSTSSIESQLVNHGFKP